MRPKYEEGIIRTSMPLSKMLQRSDGDTEGYAIFKQMQWNVGGSRRRISRRRTKMMPIYKTRETNPGFMNPVRVMKGE